LPETPKEGEESKDFNADKAELYETLGHPTRILILQVLSERAMTFSELKRKASIESSGNLAFHINKLGNLVRTNSDGNYALTDEGREALRVIEATERVVSSSVVASSSNMTGTAAPEVSKRVRRNMPLIKTTLVIVLLLLGICLVVVGLELSSETSLVSSNPTETSVTVAIQPYGEHWWWGTTLRGTVHIIYTLVTTGNYAETALKVDILRDTSGTFELVNETVLQGSYSNAYLSLPQAQMTSNGKIVSFPFVNFTIVNLSGSNITAVAFMHLDQVSHPYQSTGTNLFYLGSAIIVFDVALSIWLLFSSRRREQKDSSIEKILAETKQAG
jgi:DNA-binding HxlR family transcriptional regulator